MIVKRRPIRSKALRKAARGQICTLEIPGVCNYDPETTVLCHISYASSGMGGKPSDISACFGCHACHAVIDGRQRWPTDIHPREREWIKARAIVRTLSACVDAGLITIRGAK